MRSRNATLSSEQQIAFRIGINLGDVIVEGDDIYGDGVNVAARLDALTERGGVYLSDIVRQSIGSRLDLEFEDLGEHQVKNIARAVHVYRIRLAGDEVASELPSAGPTSTVGMPHKPSITVMPFINMSADADKEFFSDGITEDIMTALSKIRWFFIIAHSTVFAYNGRPFDVKQVAQELGVRYVLEGSTRKLCNRVRVTAQLVDATTDNHVWAERYDGDLYRKRCQSPR